MESEESVFFVPESRVSDVTAVIGQSVSFRTGAVSLKDFGREAVVACYFKSQKGLNIARSRLEQKGIRVFEADIRPTDRFLMERFITGAIEVTGRPESGNGFLRYTNPRLKPSEYTPTLRVVSLDIETSWTENILYSIAIHGAGVDKVFMIGDGTDQAANFVEFIEDEKRLIQRFLDWFSALDPDVVIGWAVVGFDLAFLQGRCDALGIQFRLGRAGSNVRWRSASIGADRNYAQVPGRVVLDGIEMLRTATWTFESFSLEFVARQLLGRGKLVEDVDARAAEIQQMFRTDKARLADYNLEDCVLVAEIFETTQLIDFAIERSRLTGLEMDRPGGSVAAFDFLYLPRLHRKGFVAPVVEDDSTAASPGGYVLNSKPGLYDHVILLDFKSLYPSIIRTFHVDPLALVCGQVEDDAIAGFRGGKFSRHYYILPEIIENLWQARDRAKLAGQAPMSQAIKIIMNSFYGVLGTPGCRFFDPRLVSSITLRGHEILQRTRDLIEERGYRVIYGDTDSVFVLLNEGCDKKDADRIGQQLMSELNEWWRNHLETEFGL
ncbi:MAG: DNA polymerase II, partial [Pseudomonadales bacterium]